MKILDRYVIISFVKNYIMSFMVLVGLYIVLDMVINFDELMEARPGEGGGGWESSLAMVRNIADYYFHQMFLFFVHLSGIIPVVAAAFTLMRMSRFNELVAMLAAGVPLLRVAAPIVLCAVVVNALLLVDQEIIIPRIIPKLVRRHDQIADSRGRFAIQAMQDRNKALLVVSEYQPPGESQRAEMKTVDIIVRDQSLQPIAHVSAEGAQWNGARWTLTNGRRVELSREGESGEIPVETYDGATPEEIELYRSGDYVQLLSTKRIDQLLEHPESYGMIDLLRVKHTRFTQPLANVILLLLAIPCVLTREPGQLRAAALRTLVLTGMCMGTIFLSQQLAGSIQPGDRLAAYWPAIMAWAPIFIFAPIAVSLLDRVKS